MKTTLLLLLLHFVVFSIAQETQIAIDWERAYGGTQNEEANAIIQTYDGGFAFTGFTESHNGDVQSGNYQSQDFWVVKIDKDGQIEWEKTYGGSGNDVAYAMLQLEDHSFLVGGYSSSRDGDIENYQGGRDYCLMKIDETGNLLWMKNYGGSENDYLRSIVQDSEEKGFFLFGSTESKDGDIHSGRYGNSDYWIVKIDSLGNIEWENTIGGSMRDNLHDACRVSDGGFILVGNTEYQQSHYVDDFDILVYKIDNRGTIEWSKMFNVRTYWTNFSINLRDTFYI